MTNNDATAGLLNLMARLRDPENGCPWDLEQDFASIAPYTIEEAYEVADAIERDNMDDLNFTIQNVANCKRKRPVYV